MVGWLLTRLGLDPTVVNGGAVVNWATAGTVGNFRAGRSDWWVIEADESDRSLLDRYMGKETAARFLDGAAGCRKFAQVS
jgi:UDP-N-acetylmuramate-alanine ligase